MMTKTGLSAFALWAAPVTAWPTGAGACPKGMAAVFGAHLEEGKELMTGGLAGAPQGLEVHLNGEPLVDGASVLVGEPAEVKLVGDMFKGFLIRFGPSEEDPDAATERATDMDLTMALNPVDSATDVKVEDLYCVPDGVAGVCHTGNEEKTMVMARLEAPEAMEYIMDITVVIANNANVTEYYHTSYMVTGMKAETLETVMEEDEETVEEDEPEDEKPSEDTASGGSVVSLLGVTITMLATGWL